MKKFLLAGLIGVASLITAINTFALTEDELETMMLDAQGALMLGDVDQAMGFCDQAIEARNDFAEGYALRSQAKLMLKDSQGAQQDANKAIELTPDSWDIHSAYYVKAIIALDETKQPEEALNYINKAIDFTVVEPIPEYYNLRADIYSALGQEEKANADISKAEDILEENFPVK